MNIGPETASWVGQSRAIAHLVSYQLLCKPSKFQLELRCLLQPPHHLTARRTLDCQAECLRGQLILPNCCHHACVLSQNISSCLNYHIPVLRILKGARTKSLLKATRNVPHPPAHTSAGGLGKRQDAELRALLCRLKHARAVSGLTPPEPAQPSAGSFGPLPVSTNAAPRQAAPRGACIAARCRRTPNFDPCPPPYLG